MIARPMRRVPMIGAGRLRTVRVTVALAMAAAVAAKGADMIVIRPLRLGNRSRRPHLDASCTQPSTLVKRPHSPCRSAPAATTR